MQRTHLGDLIDSQVLVDDEGALGVGVPDGAQQRFARSIVDSRVVDHSETRLHVIEDLSCLGGSEVACLHSNRACCQQAVQDFRSLGKIGEVAQIMRGLWLLQWMAVGHVTSPGRPALQHKVQNILAQCKTVDS